jgi:glycosyltransferase involved in cell wall biosynthesis
MEPGTPDVEQVPAGSGNGPTVSCVVPTCNRADLAERCVAAILAQRNVDLQVIVSDDSTDPAAIALIEGLAARDRRIVHAPGARTGNPVDNWNAGLDRAMGRYSVLVHHDEVLADPGLLARAVGRMAAQGAQVFLTGHALNAAPRASRFKAASWLARTLRLRPWTLYLMNWVGPTATVVFRTDRTLRFDPRLQWLVDVDFYVRLLAGGGRVASESTPSVISTPHAGQITARIAPREVALREIGLLARDGRLGRRRSAIAIAYHGLRRAFPADAVRLGRDHQ